MPQNSKRKLKYEIHTWKTARLLVKKANPDLFDQIEELNPDDSYKLILLRYNYGSQILNKGGLFLEYDDGSSVSVDDSAVPVEIQNALAYATQKKLMPVAVVLDKFLELDIGNTIKETPFSVLSKGYILSLWGFLSLSDSAIHFGDIWRVYSGCMSTYFLPKISDERSYEKLRKEFSLETPKPACLADQFEVFKEVASHFPGDWQSELLLFSGDWFEKAEGDWLKFSYYLHTVLVSKTSHLRNQIIFDYLFSYALQEKNLKPNPYLVNTVRHLFLMAEGVTPGFKFVQDDDAIPLFLLEKIFLDVYGLKDYFPLFMSLDYLNGRVGDSVYYSLEVPTVLDFQPRSSEASKLQDLIQISRILKRVLPEISNQGRSVHNVPIEKFTKGVLYECYHQTKTEGVFSLDSLLQHDNLLYNHCERYPGRSFCVTNAFMRGSVRIVKNKIVE